MTYSEINGHAAQWLRNLIDAGRLPPGDVLGDIKEIDNVETEQFHAFAGIGGWPLALALAGVPATANVWTGSCPCQPFSIAGRKGGTDDPRHLWPEWLRLIAKHRPAIIFGEQSSAPGGRAWLSTVRTDLETLGYRVGAADLCAAGIGAPHVRSRLYFGAVRMGDTNGGSSPRDPRASTCSKAQGGEGGQVVGGVRDGDRSPGTDAWTTATWHVSTDFRSRPAEPGTHPLAHGVSGRVGRLRGYGNAIVPQVAAAFISSFLDVSHGRKVVNHA